MTRGENELGPASPAITPEAVQPDNMLFQSHCYMQLLPLDSTYMLSISSVSFPYNFLWNFFKIQCSRDCPFYFTIWVKLLHFSQCQMVRVDSYL